MPDLYNDPFPSRSEIKKLHSDHQDSIIDQIKSVDISKVDFSNSGGFKPRTQIIEKQRVYFWIRAYLREDDKSLSPNDDITIRYLPTNELLETKFICYAKSGLDKDQDDTVINYNPEDDHKVLCLMVDSDRINKDSEDIPFIRTLFKIGRYYDYQLMKRDELELVIKKSGEILDYFDIDF